MILRPATLDLSSVRLCSERIARRKTDNETGNDEWNERINTESRFTVFRYNFNGSSFRRLFNHVCGLYRFYCHFKVIHDCWPIYECCLQFRLNSLIFPGKFICIYVNEKNIFINLYYINSKICWILPNFNNFRWLKSLIDRFVKIVDSRILMQRLR